MARSGCGSRHRCAEGAKNTSTSGAFSLCVPTTQQRPLRPILSSDACADKLRQEKERGYGAVRVRLKDIDAQKAAEADISLSSEYFVLAAQATMACLLLVSPRCYKFLVSMSCCVSVS